MTPGAERLKIWREHYDIAARELFGITPDVWQDEAFKAFPHSPRLAMKACAGPGKAQPVDLMLDTPDGLVRWGDLRAGDRVFAPDGSPTRVRAVYPRGRRKVYRVAFCDGSSTVACGEHLWKVRGRTERRHFKARQAAAWGDAQERRAQAQGHWVTPEDGYSILSTEDIIARNDCQDGQRRQFEIPRHRPVLYPARELPIDPYVLGVWLGDGDAYGCGSWRDEDIDSEIASRGYQTRRRSNGKVITVYGLRPLLRGAGLFGLRSHEKYVPDNYRFAGEDQRRDLLAGLMDTDGTIATDGSMSFDVTSPRLANDVAWLVRSLGGVARRRKDKAASYVDRAGQRILCRTCYRVTVTLPFNPFRLARKRARWRCPQDRYLTRYIDYIAPAGEAEVMCIEVEHPTHCYLTNDFIVTHNTMVLAIVGLVFILTHPHARCGATSISGPNLKANLWKELAFWYGKSPLLQREFEFTTKEIYHRQHRQTWGIEARTWAQDANASEIGNVLRGLHGEYVLWLLDESGSYPAAIMPVLENIFAGAPKEAHIVQAGNCTSTSGPLYRAAVTARHLWTVIDITGDPDDPKRSPRIGMEYAREQIAQYGRDNPWVMINILGQFPPSSLNSLLGPSDIEASWARRYTQRDIEQAAKVLGVDVARFGDDASIIFPRRGLVAFKPTVLRNADGNQGAGQVNRMWAESEPDAVFIDNSGGYGASWIDGLARMNRSPIPVDFSGNAADPRYFNKRTEMYFLAAEWVRRGGALPEGCPELMADLTETTYTFKGDKMLLEPKDMVKAKIGRSPDWGDGFVLTFAEPVTRRVAASAPQQGRASVFEPFRELQQLNR